MKKTFLTLLTATLLITGSTTLLSANQGSKQAKPFLIQGQLPHLSGMVKILWDDEDLALTPDQQATLLSIRQNTMKSAKALKVEIIKLENIVVKRSEDGAKPETLKEMVQKIASLRVEATMLHLKCIYNTRATLSKEQLEILE